VTGTRLILALTLALGSASTALSWGDGGLFSRKSKNDPARVRQLVEIVRSEPNAKKRVAATSELAEVDPRMHADVVSALIAALRKDASDAVRAGAAEALGRFNVVYPLAGITLEDAAESDPSPAVRGAARQALWEYHLIGYRSAKGADGFAGQTIEPPIAQPARLTDSVTAEPPTAAVAQIADLLPTPTIAPLPPVGSPPGPGVPPPPSATSTSVSAVQPHPNLTVEPPIARPPVLSIPVPAATTEPPIRPRFHEPSRVVAPPRYAGFLPAIVPDPGPATTPPLPTPTAEPPVANRPR
jgi:HEAT repeat protein